MNDEIKLKDMTDFLENIYKDIKKQPTLEEELEKERKLINKIKGDNEDEMKELLEHIKILDNTDYILHSDKAKALLDYITNLQQNYDKIYNENCKLREQHNITDISLLDENYALQQENQYLNNELNNMTDYAKDLQQENERLQQRIEYLERSNNRREDTIIGLRFEVAEQEDYKSRCEKAIEYYKTHQQECVIGRNKDERLIKDYYLPAQCSKVLLNILQKGSEKDG